MSLEPFAVSVEYAIRDAIAEAHLLLGMDLNSALDVADLWDGRVEISSAKQAEEQRDA
jgi:hypothetical protein